MYQDKVNCESVQQAMGKDSALEFTSAENEHLATCETCTSLLVIRLLQHPPAVAIPTDFPARVRSRLPAGAAAPRAHPRAPRYGFVTAIALLVLLALVWTVVAYFDPHWWMQGGRLSLVLEYVIVFEIGAIALWLGLRSPTG